MGKVNPIKVKTHTIPEAHVKDLKLAIARINKRAEELGAQPVQVYTVDAPRQELSKGGAVEIFYEIKLVGEPIQVANYQLIGAIEKFNTFSGGENHVWLVPGIEVPKSVRKADSSRCDHCEEEVDMKRRKAFILRRDNGEWKVVAANCMREFLGPKVDEAMRMAEYLFLVDYEMDNMVDGMLTSGGTERRYNLDTYISYVAAVIRKEGWVSSASVREHAAQNPDVPKMESTADIAYKAMLKADGQIKEGPEVILTNEDKQKAIGVLRWADGELLYKDETDLSNYFQNLREVVAYGVINWKWAGVAASLMVTAENDMKRMSYQGYLSETGAKSKYIGQPGEHIELQAEVFFSDLLPSLDEKTPRNNRIIKLVDTEGNRYVWFSDSAAASQFVVGKVLKFKATVLRHEPKYGEYQTIIGRARNIEMVSESPRKALRHSLLAPKVVMKDLPPIPEIELRKKSGILAI
jgi:hypothetical protein